MKNIEFGAQKFLKPLFAGKHYYRLNLSQSAQLQRLVKIFTILIKQEKQLYYLNNEQQLC